MHRLLRVLATTTALTLGLVAAAFPAERPPGPVEALVASLRQQAPAVDGHVLALALEAQATALRRGLLSDPVTLTVIDYSRPSIQPRFWVFDLREQRLLFEELVAHGRNSGEDRAMRFSNRESSLQSSLGLFVTGGTYLGQHGRSLRLAGLEPGVNDRAAARAIVIHGADYVDSTFAARTGRLGRSWGCPALPSRVAADVIDRIQGGSAVFAYYPDAQWLARSAFLHSDR